ncbi:MAG: PAS domain S-box protein, partial [Pseudomonadota bacterium]|nr:PAS domain S-box protein [Pseudomonadota bacterium]
TDRKQAEEALKKEKVFSEKIVENAKAIIVGLDKDHIIRIFNRGAEQITGYTKEEVIGKDWFKIFFPKEMLDEMNKVWKDSWGVKSHSYINPILSKTGEEKIVSWQMTGIYDGDDVSKHLLLSIGEDITDRKQAEEQLQNEREKLFVTLRSIGDGVITTDTDGRVTFMNGIAEELTGWSQGEAAGRPLSEVFHIINEKTGVPGENPVTKVLKIGKIIGLANHTALIARDGTQRSIADSAAPIHSSAQGKILGVVLVFRDVTDKKKREEELLKIKKLESVGVLAGGIAHDFNNILTAILGNISLADMYIEKENKAHLRLKEAEKASLRAKDLTQQLLTFSKGGDPVRETTSITQVITDSADFVLHGSNVLCRYAIPEDLWLVDIDTGQMSQVIQNLVINARHAMPEGGEINISGENIADITKETGLSLPEEKYIKITIADTGGGIPEKYLDKIFDPYFSTKQQGSGLGLAVTHSIINKHDGHIFVRSKSGEGTTFIIYLPAAAEQISRDAGAEAQAPEKTARGTILVMDDEEMIQNLAKAMLSRFGHEVLQAKDGREAIVIFQEHQGSDNPVDVIIMDLTIPGGMGGKEAIKEILKIDPEAKAIVSSGYANDPVMANYRQYGFKASIGKPFKMAQLKETIDAVLG